MKVYLRIGLYQSVVPVPLDEISTTLRFPNVALRFEFYDSGEKADDGVPIWTAADVAMSYDVVGTGLRPTDWEHAVGEACDVARIWIARRGQ